MQDITDVNNTGKECSAVVVDTGKVQSDTSYFKPILYRTVLLYTECILYWMYFIPNVFYTERILYRTYFILKVFYSERILNGTYFIPICFIQNLLIPNSFYAELIRYQLIRYWTIWVLSSLDTELRGALGGVGGHCELGGELGWTCFIPNFATLRAGRGWWSLRAGSGRGGWDGPVSSSICHSAC